MRVNDDAVFLLGAGASKEAGVPTSYELMEEISAAVGAERQYQPLAAALNFVSAALMLYDAASDGASPYEGLDVERVFAAVQLLARRRDLEVSPFVAAWHPAVDGLDRSEEVPLNFDRELNEGIFGTFPGVPPFPGRTARAIIKLIDVRTGRSSGRNYEALAMLMVEKLRELVSTTAKEVHYLRPLVERGRGPRGVTIATLNYDRSIELAAQASNVVYSTGLESWIDSGSWRWPELGARVLKLHGSIDWLWRDEQQPGRLPRQVVTKAEPPYDAGPPALIFGQGAKLQAKGPFLGLLAEFERELAQASQLVCIGYSFRDDHVNEVIRRWSADAMARLSVEA